MTRRCNALAILAWILAVTGCSDAATRVAYDVESGVGTLASSEGARAEIVHRPSSWPEGCSGPYMLRIGKGTAINEGNGNFHIGPNSSGLSVNCYAHSGNQNGWGTTYHLRFVDVPRTFEIVKQSGEAAVIEIQRQAGRAVVVGLR